MQYYNIILYTLIYYTTCFYMLFRLDSNQLLPRISIRTVTEYAQELYNIQMYVSIFKIVN